MKNEFLVLFDGDLLFENIGGNKVFKVNWGLDKLLRFAMIEKLLFGGLADSTSCKGIVQWYDKMKFILDRREHRVERLALQLKFIILY